MTLGTLIGLLTGVYALPLLPRTILSGYSISYIVALPLTFIWGGVLVVSCPSIFTVVFGSWPSSKSIKQAPLPILMAE